MRASMSAAGTALAVLLCGGCETVYGPTSPSVEWAVFESSRYTLNVRPGSFCESQAAALAEVLEDQYRHTVATLQIEAGGRIAMFLYNSGAELEPALPSARSGVAFPETNAAHAVCSAPLDNDLRALLTHEANHVIIQNALGRAGTSFMNEGLASALVSDRHAPIGPTFLRMWVGGNRARLRRIVDLVDDAKWNSSSENYNSSAAFLVFLLDRYGPQSIKQIYHTTSSDMAARVQAVYGKSIEALEAEWLASF